MSKITCEQAVQALKEMRLSTTACIASYHLGTDSRAVASALRGAVKDGRVSISYKKGIAFYRFVRLTAKSKEASNAG